MWTSWRAADERGDLLRSHCAAGQRVVQILPMAPILIAELGHQAGSMAALSSRAFGHGA